MKNLKRVLSLALALALCLLPSANCLAASETTGRTPVSLTAEAMTFSVTVPTDVSVHVAADGDVTVGQGGAIINHSAGPVKLTGCRVVARNGWELFDWAFGTEGQEDCVMPGIGEKKIALAINGVGAPSQAMVDELGDGVVGEIDPSDMDWSDGVMKGDDLKPVIPGGGKLDLEYQAMAPVQKTAIGGDVVATVVYTVGCHEEVVSVPVPRDPEVKMEFSGVNGWSSSLEESGNVDSDSVDCRITVMAYAPNCNIYLHSSDGQVLEARIYDGGTGPRVTWTQYDDAQSAFWYEDISLEVSDDGSGFMQTIVIPIMLLNPSMHGDYIVHAVQY